MTIDTAKQIGGRRALINQVYAIVIWEIFCFFAITEGDFANGLIFFIDGQMNPGLITFFVLLLGATYFLGRSAGKEIFNRPDRYITPGLKYAALVSMIVLAYLIIVVGFFFERGPEGAAAFGALLAIVWLIGTIVAVWLVATKEVMRKIQGAN